MKIKEITEKDYLKILKLNNANIPAVSKLSEDSLKEILEMSLRGWVIELDDVFVGFCIIIGPHENYKSDNYRWVCENYEEFEYLDRVVISEKFQGQRFGQKLYEHWFLKSESPSLLLEVNIKPMNAGSIRFHERLGFIAVGEQDTENGKKRVQYMARNK